MTLNMPNNLLRTIHLLLIAIIAFVSVRPVIFWGYYKYAFALLAGVLVVTLVSTTNKFKFSRLLFGGAILGLVGLYSILSGTSFFWGGVLSLYTFVVLILSKDERVISFNYFRNIFVISLIPGLILWFLHHLSGDASLFSLGFVPDAIVPNQLKVENGERYTLYPFSVVPYGLISMPYRFCGMYDEPGVVGTLAALFLVADKVQLDKKLNIILFISGILSFSLAFFVIIFIYYMLMVRHHFIKIAVITAVLSSLFIVYVPEDSFVYRYLIYRITVSSDTGWQGDNRETINIKSGFNEWLNSDLTQFLYGIDDLEQDAGSSWKMIFINTGIIGCLLIMLILFLPVFNSINSINYSSIVFVLVFLSSIYQRPDVINPSMLLLFYTGFFRLIRDNHHYSESKNLATVSNSAGNALM